MRVAIVVPRLDQLGPVLFVQALVNKLYVFENMQIKVFYIDKFVDQQLKMFVPVERLDYFRFRFSEFDIVHTNGIRPDLFAFLNRRYIKYHISTIHNFVFEDLKYTYNRFISILFGYFWLLLWSTPDKLVCITGEMKKYYEKWFSASKLQVIYCGIRENDISFVPDRDFIAAIDRLHSMGHKIIGTAAILTKRKGLEQIIQTIALENDFAFVVIGKGKELAGLQKTAEKFKISDRCYFSGFRSYAVNYFKCFDVFIIPSRSEGLGLSLIEAVQQRIPVICSDIPVFRDLFSDDCVTFFKLDDNRSLLEALIKALSEEGIRKVDLAYKKYKLRYLDIAMAENYFKLYQSA